MRDSKIRKKSGGPTTCGHGDVPNDPEGLLACVVLAEHLLPFDGLVGALLHQGLRVTRSGHPIQFCWLFSIKDRRNKVHFSTNTQSRFASVVVDSVMGPPRLAGHS